MAKEKLIKKYIKTAEIYVKEISQKRTRNIIYYKGIMDGIKIALECKYNISIQDWTVIQEKKYECCCIISVPNEKILRAYRIISDLESNIHTQSNKNHQETSKNNGNK